MVLGVGRPKLPKTLSYEESRELAQNGSDRTRADLAQRPDLRPEVLYFLADDPPTEVRRRTAANARTPRQAVLIMARVTDEAVSAVLAANVPTLTAPAGRSAQEKAQRSVEQTQDMLARARATRDCRNIATAR